MGRGQGRRNRKVEAPRGRSVGRRGLVLAGIAALIVVLVAWYFLGTNPTPQQGAVDSNGGIADSSARLPGGATGPATSEDPEEAFLSTVLDDTEDAWSGILKATGARYAPPKLATFNGAMPSACGFTAVAMGPFYCPAERKLYIDLDFLRELRQRFQGAGDYAAAYVIAHEIGHHVQELTGSAKLAQQLLEPPSEEDAGEMAAPDANTPDVPKIIPLDAREITLMVELQADCYAGIWVKRARGARQFIDEGDVEKALAAATTIGNDLLRQQARGYVMPDSFTHGTAEQRVRWFRTGLTTGDIQSCETFAAPEL